MNTPTQIVNVTLNISRGIPYTIRGNCDVQTVKEYAEENPMVWVFVFYTCTTEDVDDWSGIEFQKIGSWAYRVVKPLLIGNVDRPWEDLQKYIDAVIGEDKYLVN